MLERIAPVVALFVTGGLEAALTGAVTGLTISHILADQTEVFEAVSFDRILL